MTQAHRTYCRGDTRELSLGTQTVVQLIFALIDVVSVNGAFQALLSAVSQLGTRDSPFYGLAAGPRFPFTCDPVITNDVLYQLSYCGGPCRARSG